MNASPNKEIFKFRGKIFTQDDITEIKRIVKKNWSQGRCQISRAVCRHFNWRQHNNELKEGLCRTFLVRLERQKIITLPEPIRIPGFGPIPAGLKPKPVAVDKTPIECTLKSALETLSLQDVKKTPREKDYNGLVEQFGGGYRRPVGENRKYIAYINNRPVACIGLSAVPRYISCRDTYLGWSPTERNEKIHLLAKMDYFLVLPWVSVRGLDEKLMKLFLDRIRRDWESRFGHPLIMLEAYVDPQGASNIYDRTGWTRIGRTAGISAKKGETKPRRDVYVFKLSENAAG